MARNSTMRWFFLFFFLSGFCSLIYEVVWLRIAMAQFGVNIPLVSMFLSAFMAGMGLGSVAAGRIARRRQNRGASSDLRLYAAAEATIALCGPLMPAALRAGRAWLDAGAGGSWASASYFAASGAWIAASLLVPCLCMGATIPFAMAGIGKLRPEASTRSFSFLYLANVLGASAGTLMSAFVFIEKLGFQNTLRLTAMLNAAAAAAIFAWSVAVEARKAAAPKSAAAAAGKSSSNAILALLFWTGCAGMGMEVIWSRLFTPFVGTYVYAFAGILALYLLATFGGSQAYRRWAKRGDWRTGLLWLAAGVAGASTLLWIDWRIPFGHGYAARFSRLVPSIVPFCAALGFLTSMLVDEFSDGDPDLAGTAYAFNILGSIAGPLVAGFGMLPFVKERWALLALMVPFLATGIAWSKRKSTAVAPLIAVLLIALFTRDFEDAWSRKTVRRDATATVIALDADQPFAKRIIINGIGETQLTPTTKMMSHWPLLFVPSPRSGLVICFGMGTSFRSMLSWGIPTTAVELVPSVPPLMGVFHQDAERILSSPLAHVVIDDGRRFLERTGERFDVIVIDPPPPEEAAGSSLLHSREFYQAARRRLAPGGVLQQWIIGGDRAFLKSAALALAREFPYIRVYRAIAGPGYHFLASESPIVTPPLPVLLDRMPAAAQKDMCEWGPEKDARAQIARMLGQEIPLSSVLDGPEVPELTDDRPFNEYFLLRSYGF